MSPSPLLAVLLVAALLATIAFIVSRRRGPVARRDLLLDGGPEQRWAEHEVRYFNEVHDPSNT